MIELKGICKTFNELTALKGVDLSIQESEIFGVIGKSGAGKSTLLRIINLLEKPDIGQVFLDQEELTHLSPALLRKARQKTGMIFQHFNLLETKNVYENIALPMRIQGHSPEAIKKRVHELLPLVELTHKINHYPSQLSGGQKQRVAIARALACSPKVLLCDEATSALDPETTESILDLLKQINHQLGLTIVLITHEMHVIRRICQRLAVMDEGQIREVTSLASAFKNPEGLAKSMLFDSLNPQLPASLSQNMILTETERPILKLCFQGSETTVPFLSQTSRSLNLDINILQANIDRFDALTCGVILVELLASRDLLQRFQNKCKEHNISVEVVGYVTDHVL